MSGTVSSSGTQAGADGQPQAGNDSAQVGTSGSGQDASQQGQAPAAQSGQVQQQDSQQQQPQRQQPRNETERLRQEAEEARREAAATRIKLREFENRDLSEQQRVTRDLDETRTTLATTQAQLTELQAQNLTLRAGMALSRRGCNAPELIAQYVKAEDLADDDGKAMDERAKALRKQYPALFSVRVQGSADGATDGAPQDRGTDMNAMIRARRGGVAVS